MKYWHKVWTANTDFGGRKFPLIYLANGEPGFVINQWIYWLIEGGMPENTLASRITHVMALYDFHYCTYQDRLLSQLEAQNLISDFLKAKQYGHKALGWKPIRRTSTLKDYWRSICLFDEWHATFHGADRMTPFETRMMTAWELWCRWQQRERWSPNFHLTPSLDKTTKQRASEPFRFEHRALRLGNKRLKKAFPFERFVELVEKTPNPRDQMAWLLMGGCSLRMSETLHLFTEDVVPLNAKGFRRIRVDHPEQGKWVYERNGIEVEGTRQEYFQGCFKNEEFRYTNPSLYYLKPRTQGIKDRDHAGFKGMTFRATEPETLDSGRIVHPYYAVWLDKAIAKRFAVAYEQYMETFIYGKPPSWPQHPWLLISTHGKDYGLPWTIGSMKQAWRRALKRLRMENSGLGNHSLRHMYGGCCAQAGVPLEQTMMNMHHVSPVSTAVYYHIKHAQLQETIFKAMAQKPEERSFYVQPNEQARSNYLSVWK